MEFPSDNISLIAAEADFRRTMTDMDILYMNGYAVEQSAETAAKRTAKAEEAADN